MNLEVFDVIVFVTGGVLGFVIGMLSKTMSTKNTTNTSNPFLNPESLQQELDKKQVAIDDFFTEADESLRMTEKRLHELRVRLAHGAKNLNSIAITKATTEEISNKDLDIDPLTTEPPKDYSIKAASGTLKEGFGLHQPASETIDEPKRI